MLGRSLNIFDLPDEIPMKISALAKGRKPDEVFIRYDYPDREVVSSIKNLRLTSRRFCNASSHLLLHATSVEMTPSSLSRLEKISRHPRVQKGVRGVRVDLHYFVYSEESLTQRLLLPINFDEARYYQLAGPPSGLLSTLPVGIHNAGVSLTHLHIEVSPLRDYTTFASTQPKLRALTASAQSLKDFSFVCRGMDADLFPIRSESNIDGLKKFLMALLDTSSLSEFLINLDSLWDNETQPSFGFGLIIHFRTWPNLDSFHTSTLPLRLAELERFVNHLPRALRYIELKATRLLGGTWAEALDALKQQSGRGWSIDIPSGGECDTMSKEENQAIFGTSYETWDDDSLANKYLHGVLKENPLRERE